jgi:alpha-L-rhamnosidase
MRWTRVGMGALAWLALASLAQAGDQTAIRVEQLRCEYLHDPQGIDVAAPRLSWVLLSEVRGQKQTAYRVLVASSAERLAADEADLWDSGKIDGDQTIHVVYQGKPLRTRMRCFWKVRVWDKDGKPSAWSRLALWSMGLLKPDDWQAQWIAAPIASSPAPQDDIGDQTPATMLRKEFDVPRPIVRAVVSVTGLGLYELRINGQQVGDHRLAPEWTLYSKRIQYQTYDVTDMLRRGKNAVGAQVAPGWWRGPIGSQVPKPKARECLRMRLDIELADGGRQTLGDYPEMASEFCGAAVPAAQAGETPAPQAVLGQHLTTDASWQATTAGPIRRSGIYFGESYDATREMPGWDQPGFRGTGWLPAQVVPFPDGAERAKLVAQCNEPIRVVKELRPVKVSEPKPGVYVFDMGQNMVGWCRLRADAPAGAKITVRHGEILNKDGAVYTSNLLNAAQVNQYTWPGGKASLEPHFTYHGFRYVEVSGLRQRPADDAVVGRVFHSDARETGRFACSNELLNKIMHCVQWVQRGNMMSVPTDCPQRAERLGWMGDVQAFSQTAIFQRDMAAFFTKWMVDICDSQADDGRLPDVAPYIAGPNAASLGTPAWADAGVIIPWRMYQNYADARMLEERFESARRWIEFVRVNNPNCLWQKERGNDYGDWNNGSWLTGDAPFDKVVTQPDLPRGVSDVPREIFATAFYAHSAEILAKMAKALKRNDDAARYSGLFQNIKAAFNRAYVSPDGRIRGDTQAGYALALHFSLIEESLRPKAAEHMVAAIRKFNNHLSTGIQCSHRMMLALTQNGRHDEAWRLINLRTVPSWGYMVEKGATTIWERWDAYLRGQLRNPSDPSPWAEGSYNHCAYGSVGEWVWRELAGINPDDEQPGYKHFVIRPRPCPGLSWVKAEYDSIRGKIVSDWEMRERRFTLRVAVPVGSTATVCVPAKDADVVTESGVPAAQAEGVKFVKMEAGTAVFAVESGRYVFQAEMGP